MFTGIVIAQGRVVNRRVTPSGCQLTIRTPVKISARLKPGASVSIDGACLTVLKKQAERLVFELLPETMQRTTLGDKPIGAVVNIEPALRAHEALGGHLVFGHIDGVGRVHAIIPQRQGGTNLSIVAPRLGYRWLVPQGAITINGVSLTLVELGRPCWFSVALTSYTQKHTNLGALQKNALVNLEFDILAKYLEHFLKFRAPLKQ